MRPYHLRSVVPRQPSRLGLPAELSAPAQAAAARVQPAGQTDALQPHGPPLQHTASPPAGRQGWEAPRKNLGTVCLAGLLTLSEETTGWAANPVHFNIQLTQKKVLWSSLSY